MGNLDYTIWTDGGCAENPNGKGGYGIVIQNNATQVVTTIYEGFKSSTNNRMEVRAIIRALEEIPDGCTALIYSDSKYAIFTLNGEYKKKKNLDLWPIAEALLARKSNVVFQWVKGHADNDNNNICDELATKAQALDDDKLLVDEGFVPLPTKPKKAKPTKEGDKDTPTSTQIGAMKIVIEPMIPDAYVNDDCYALICSVNAKTKPSFADFANLKTGGKDFWSMQPIEALEFYFGAYLVSYVKSYFEDEKQMMSAIRWHGRGLTIENAIRKAMVDAEISNNR